MTDAGLGCPAPVALVVWLFFVVEGVACYAEVVLADEVGDYVAYFRWVDVGFDAAQSVEYRDVALVYVAVGFCYVVDVGVGVAELLHYHVVYSVVAGGVVCHDGEWAHVVADSATAFSDWAFAHG